MSANYDAVYIDLDTGKKIFLDRPVNSPYKQLKYLQDAPADVWTIFHQQNMNSFVTIFFDKDNNEIKPSKYYMHDGTTSVAEFSSPVAGYALLIFFEGDYITPPNPSATPTPSVTLSSTATPLVSVTPTHSGVWLSPTPTPSITKTATPTPTLTPTSTPGSFNQPFDYALIRYTWTANNGTDLDTRTAIINPPRNIDVGWNRANSDEAYLTWGGDNTSASGPEAVLVDFNAISNAYSSNTSFTIRLRLNWYGTRIDGNVGVVFESYLGGTMVHSGTDFVNSGGQLVNSATIYVNCVSNNPSNVDGSDIGSLVYDNIAKTAQFYPLVPAVTPTPTATVSPTISVTPSVTPTISVTPSNSPSISLTPSITPTITVTPSVTRTIIPTMTLTPSLVAFGNIMDVNSGNSHYTFPNAYEADKDTYDGHAWVKNINTFNTGKYVMGWQLLTQTPDEGPMYGMMPSTSTAASLDVPGANGWGWQPYRTEGVFARNNTGQSYTIDVAVASANDIVMMAVDFDAGLIWYGLNGVWANGADPSVGTHPTQTFTPDSSILWQFGGSAYFASQNFKALVFDADFNGFKPSGYLATSYTNYPSPTPSSTNTPTPSVSNTTSTTPT